MPSLQCNCNDCGHNKENYCCLPDIKVEGMGVQEKNKTCCHNFFQGSGAMNTAKSFNGVNPALIVNCDAQHCKFHDRTNKCQAQSIEISYQNNQSRQNSYCKSFTL